MRGVLGLVIVAILSHRQGKREGRTEGTVTALGHVSAAFLAGVRRGEL